jgi:hypothetical protein
LDRLNACGSAVSIKFDTSIGKGWEGVRDIYQPTVIPRLWGMVNEPSKMYSSFGSSPYRRVIESGWTWKVREEFERRYAAVFCIDRSQSEFLIVEPKDLGIYALQPGFISEVP